MYQPTMTKEDFTIFNIRSKSIMDLSETIGAVFSALETCNYEDDQEMAWTFRSIMLPILDRISDISTVLEICEGVANNDIVDDIRILARHGEVENAKHHTPATKA